MTRDNEAILKPEQDERREIVLSRGTSCWLQDDATPSILMQNLLYLAMLMLNRRAFAENYHQRNASLNSCRLLARQRNGRSHLTHHLRVAASPAHPSHCYHGNLIVNPTCCWSILLNISVINNYRRRLLSLGAYSFTITICCKARRCTEDRTHGALVQV